MVYLSKKYSLIFFSFDICNSLQSLSSLATHVSFWFIFTTLLFFSSLTKIISGLILLKGNSMRR